VARGRDQGGGDPSRMKTTDSVDVERRRRGRVGSLKYGEERDYGYKGKDLDRTVFT
jgi:hypothetical protein